MEKLVLGVCVPTLYTQALCSILTFGDWETETRCVSTLTISLVLFSAKELETLQTEIEGSKKTKEGLG